MIPTRGRWLRGGHRHKEAIVAKDSNVRKKETKKPKAKDPKDPKKGSKTG